MNKSRLEWKVGLFVIIGLILIAALLVQFSKGTSPFKGTYRIFLKSGNGNGLKAKATVNMAGVQIGTVENIQLGPQGTIVWIIFRTSDQFAFHTSAEFLIEPSAFLADQYLAIAAKPAPPEL